MPERHESDGNDGHGAEEQCPHDRDAAEDVREVTARWAVRAGCPEQPTLLAYQVGLLVRVEGDVHIKKVNITMRRKYARM